MKKLKVLCNCILLAAMVLLYGCPYDSEFPLSRHDTAIIDTALIGTWQYKNSDHKETGLVTILPFSENELLISMQGDDKCKYDFFRAFGSVVKGDRFLNIQELRPSAEKRTWMLAGYSISGSELKIRLVEDKLFKYKKIESSAALNDFIKANLKNEDLYGGEGATVMKFVKYVGPKTGGE
ncbi:MAG TPA: hypothetical protein VMB78_04455 [Dissulfurispiraceae bacterium]|nr:hypothetical protein [Dissulfurispiraceae bacterium]